MSIKRQRKEFLPPVAKRREHGTAILLGLKGYEVEKVTEEEVGIIAGVKPTGASGVNCLRCSSTKLYRHGSGKRRRVLHSWSNGKKVYLELHCHRWQCRECGHSFNDGSELVRRYSRITRQAEQEVLWQLKEHSFSQIRREMGVGYGALRRLLEREIDEEALSFIPEEEEIFLGIDEHSFRHQELVHTITEVKIVADPFHVIADSNKRMDEARRIEQDVHWKRRIQIPKKIFLIGREKLAEEKIKRVDGLLDRYPSLKGFYWAKEKIGEFYRQENREEATKILNNIIFNLKSSDDGELIRWSNTLKHWREPILNHFENMTTNGFTEGCNTKIKMLKRVSYGLRNVEVYWRKMLLGFVPSQSCFHTI